MPLNAFSCHGEYMSQGFSNDHYLQWYIRPLWLISPESEVDLEI